MRAESEGTALDVDSGHLRRLDARLHDGVCCCIKQAVVVHPSE